MNSFLLIIRRVDEVSAEVRRLEMASKQKEERYLALEKR